jgi:hypothetical protein
MPCSFYFEALVGLLGFHEKMPRWNMAHVIAHNLWPEHLHHPLIGKALPISDGCEILWLVLLIGIQSRLFLAG